jgi:hypothetical protein
LGGPLSKLCVTPPFSINFRCQIENQVSDYRLLGASSLILYEIVEIKNMNKLIKYMKYLLILDCSRFVYHALWRVV